MGLLQLPCPYRLQVDLPPGSPADPEEIPDIRVPGPHENPGQSYGGFVSMSTLAAIHVVFYTVVVACMVSDITWSHVPTSAVVSCASHVPRTDVGNYL